MANRADVLVKNMFTGGIQVIRKLVDGISDLEMTLEKGNQEKIYLPGPEVELVIKAPAALDIKESFTKVKSDVDLTISHSRTHSSWTFKIEPNDLPPDSPATVNITIGDDEPE